MTRHLVFLAKAVVQFPTALAQKCASPRLWISLFLLLAVSVQAANWYVRPGGGGSKNGMDWNNAWDCSGINWSSITPGDTIWMAGGTYTSVNANDYSMVVNASGSAGNYIFIKRVLSTDGVPTAAAGWNSSFDSQVVIAPAPADSACIVWTSSAGAGSHVYIDGRVDSGILAELPTDSTANGDGAIDFPYGANKQTDIVFTNIDMLGPEHTLGAFGNPPALPSPFAIYGWNGTTYASMTNIVITHCRLHGGVDAINVNCTASGLVGLTVDHCLIYDNGTEGDQHPDTLQLTTVGPMIFRYNICWNWDSMFIFVFPPNDSRWYIYGNIFHDPTQGTDARLLEASGNVTPSDNIGPIYFVNNTLYKFDFSTLDVSPAGGWTSPGSVWENNLYINCANEYYDGSAGVPPGTWDYNYANNNILTDAHGINNSGINPLVNPGSTNFMIVTNIGALYPRNKGTPIASASDSFFGTIDFSKDMNGNTRGADGAWDIGAYEYTGVVSTVSYTITASAGKGGSISPSGPVSVSSGSSQTFTIAPLSGYQVFSVTVDGTNAGSVASYTFSNVLTNHTIAAVFGTTAVIQVTPSSLSFGNVLNESSATNSFTVQNVGGGALSGTATVSAPFNIVSGGSYNLGTNESQTVTVVFSPIISTNYSDSVTLTGGGGAAVQLIGSAVPAAPSNIRVVSINP